MAHLALIGTPGHYFNLMECITQLKLNKKEIDLVAFCLDGDEKMYNFIQNQILSEEWKSMEVVPIWNKAKGLLRTGWNLAKYLKFRGRKRDQIYDTVIANQYDVIYQLALINSIKYHRLVSMDEGNAVFRVVEERKKRSEHNEKKSILFSFLKLDTKPPSKITFFSSYDLNLPICDTLVSCKYEYSQSILLGKEMDRSVSFIGSPYANDGILSKEEHYDNISAIRGHYQGREIRYYAHRRESKELLNRYKTEFRFIIQENDLPLELAFFEQKTLSGEVVGFCSAALYNLNRILRDTKDITFCTIGIDYKMLLKPKLEETYRNIYQTYIDKGIEYVILKKKSSG